ncbi:MAG: KH domain-containing protein [Candidatus Levybacteria bacterium]|nr:KH domain-containing protein [Candidatus Levybacteria bacterium]
MAKGQKITEKVVKDFLSSLGIDEPIQISENEDGYEIVLETEDSGIVIGRHGDTLESLQLLISLMLSNKTGEFRRVSLEVGDYKKNRSDWLRNLAQETKERVVSEQKEVYLPNLKSWERRLVHLELQEDDEVASESVGEGKDRVLVVKPKV